MQVKKPPNNGNIKTKTHTHKKLCCDHAVRVLSRFPTVDRTFLERKQQKKHPTPDPPWVCQWLMLLRVKFSVSKIMILDFCCFAPISLPAPAGCDGPVKAQHNSQRPNSAPRDYAKATRKKKNKPTTRRLICTVWYGGTHTQRANSFAQFVLLQFIPPNGAGLGGFMLCCVFFFIPWSWLIVIPWLKLQLRPISSRGRSGACANVHKLGTLWDAVPCPCRWGFEKSRVLIEPG